LRLVCPHRTAGAVRLVTCEVNMNPALDSRRCVALIFVPPFLKNVQGPLLGPAMLAGAAQAAGHEACVVDLARQWLLDRAPATLTAGAGPFVGDHDRPSDLLAAAELGWSEACGGSRGGESHPRRLVAARGDHEELAAAASCLLDGAVGSWMRGALERHADPDVVAVSVMYAGQVLAALALSTLAKRLWPSALVVWGGAHVTALRDQIATDARYGAVVDRFVFGYAESTFIRMLDAVAGGRGLPHEVVAAGSGRCALAADDGAVVPAFELPAAARRVTLPTQASRGCAYARCRFCTYPAVEGTYRPLEFAAVDSAVEQAARIGAAVSFKDSLILPARLELLADRIRGRVRWSACTKLHPRMDVPFLTSLVEGGCATLEVGLETLTEQGQLVIDKRQPLALLLTVLDAAEAAGLALVINYITGFPGVDAADERQQLSRLRAEVGRRPRLAAKVEHNHFELERMSPMGRNPSAFGLRVVGEHPWLSVLEWAPVEVGDLRRAG
jgi:hypothetical protein